MHEPRLTISFPIIRAVMLGRQAVPPQKPPEQPSRRQPFIITALAVCSVFLVLYLAHSMYDQTYAKSEQLEKIPHQVEAKQKVISPPQAQKERRAPPVYMKIPRINVDTIVETVSVSSDGEMGVPQSVDNVGWLEVGSRPGEMGSAVITGHSSGENGVAGAFIHLNGLRVGDILFTEDSRGQSTAFMVREIRTFDPGHADEVFGQNNGIYLNLITCEGVWDKAKKSYSKRLVIFTEMVH